MQRKIVTTGDGSTSIYISEWEEHYHSKHGAIQEAKHVFIESGLIHFLTTQKHQNQKSISVLEIGFGTGLNAFMTLLDIEKRNLSINYTGVEGFPISGKEIEQLNYVSCLEVESKRPLFLKMHTSPWEKELEITPFFKLNKQKKQFSEINNLNTFDLVYFDAFGPRVQPELWTQPIFALLYKAMKSKGVLVTYCAQGNARRAMQSVGFNVERIEGPPGKRHMLRANKL